MNAEFECEAKQPADCPVLNRRHDDPRWLAFGERMDSFDAALAENMGLTRQVKQNTDDIVVLFQNARGFIRILAVLGVFAKWVTAVTAVTLFAWAAFKYGVSTVLNGHRGGGD